MGVGVMAMTMGVWRDDDDRFSDDDWVAEDYADGSSVDRQADLALSIEESREADPLFAAFFDSLGLEEQGPQPRPHRIDKRTGADLDDPFIDADAVAKYAVEGDGIDTLHNYWWMNVVNCWAPYPKCPQRESCRINRACRNGAGCDWREFQ